MSSVGEISVPGQTVTAFKIDIAFFLNEFIQNDLFC